ncbi:pectinesterase inhibitor 8-like [Triticum dicoccoides]|uniref:pectinesterase inhibitor 8-like n=1 Tax=Triticum dicoccoides TaxID=85692 RepID=UPI000E79F6B7|nr:pectinesterase inhibitor 8-like [Triticum dicoccoides]
MKASTARLLAAAALTVILALASGVANATVVTTCKAAAGSDGRVDYDFCVSELGKHHDSPSADTWGLAKVAALTGVVDADNAVYDIKDLLAKHGTDARAQAALGQCQELYDSMGYAFAEAQDDINNRDYAAGKEKAGEAASLAHRCNDAFAQAGVPSPVTQHTSYSVQIAVVCTAITNLIQ